MKIRINLEVHLQVSSEGGRCDKRRIQRDFKRKRETCT